MDLLLRHLVKLGKLVMQSMPVVAAATLALATVKLVMQAKLVMLSLVELVKLVMQARPVAAAATLALAMQAMSSSLTIE